MIVYRRFNHPMDWASNTQLEIMRLELLEELRGTPVDQFEEQADKNGFSAIQEEIEFRKLEFRNYKARNFRAQSHTATV